MAILLLLVLLPFALAAIAYLCGRKSEKAASVITIISTAVIMAGALYAVFGNVIGDEIYKIPLLGISFVLDGFRRIYILVIAFMWFSAALASPQYFNGHKKTARYYFFFLTTLASTLGVFLSADLFTTFLFFELMSFTSYVWVVQEQTSDAVAAGKTYLTIAVVGGLVALMGIFILYAKTGTIEISSLYAACSALNNKTPIYAAAFCMLFGFGAKAGIFPLHIWLPKAHPVAPAPASALLSGVLTKAGIFGILIITTEILRGDFLWGSVLLILGVITMLLGALLALFSNNLKYVLASSSLSQIGFIVVGIAMACLLGGENSIAASGVVLYMLNHSIVKLTLFLSAGVIYTGTHSLDLNKIRGYGRGKPLLTFAFLCGGLSLAGIPMLCGYVSKTLVHEAIVEYAAHGGALITVVEWLFLISGGITLAYVTKLFVAIFVEKPHKKSSKKKYVTPLTALSLLMGPVILLALGIFPNAIADKVSSSALGFLHAAQPEHSVHYFSYENLKGIGISIIIGIIIYFIVVRKLLLRSGKYYEPHLGFSLEDNVYVPVCSFLNIVITTVCRAVSDLPSIILFCIRRFILTPEGEKKQKWYPILTFTGDTWDTIRKRKQKATAENLVNAYTTIHDTTGRILSNFSFALLMTCLGICIILVFLLLR